MKLRIALIGYGKMGKAVEAEARTRGHEIKARFDMENQDQLHSLTQEHIDVAIEFTHPKSFGANLSLMLEKGIPMVSGTTGWYDSLEIYKEWVHEKEGSFLFASNFSIGVNILFQLNRRLAELMNPLRPVRSLCGGAAPPPQG